MALNAAYNAVSSLPQNDPAADFVFELFFGNGWGGNSPYAQRLGLLLEDCINLNLINNRPNSLLTVVMGFAGHLFCQGDNDVLAIADTVNLSRQGEQMLLGFGNNEYRNLLQRIDAAQNQTYNNRHQQGGNNFNNYRNNNNNRFNNNYNNNRQQRSYGSYGNGGYNNGRGGNNNRPNFNGTYAQDGQFAPNIGSSRNENYGESIIAQKREELRKAQAERYGAMQNHNDVNVSNNVFDVMVPKIDLGYQGEPSKNDTTDNFPKPENLNVVKPRYEMVNDENISTPMGEEVDTEHNRWALMEKEIGSRVPEEWRDLPWDIRYFAPILYSFKTRKPYWTTKTICGITYLSVGFKKVDEMNRADHEFPTFGAALDNVPAYDLAPAVEQLKDYANHPERYQIEDLRKAHDEWKNLAEKAKEEWAEWENVNKEKAVEEQSEKPAPIPEVPEKVNFIAAKKQLLGYTMDTARNYMFSTSKSFLDEEAINVMSCNYYSYEYIGTFMSKEMVMGVKKAFAKLNGINKPVMGKALTPVEFTRIIDAVVTNLTNAETGDALDKMFTKIVNEMLQYNMGIDASIDSVLTNAEGSNDLVDLGTNIREDMGEAYYQALGAFQWNLINRLSIMDSTNEISASSDHYLGKLTNHSLVEIVTNPLAINCRGITEEATRLAAVCDTEGQHLINEEASPELFSILSRFMPRFNENEFREVEFVIGNASYKGYLNYLDGNRQTKSNANSFVLVAK